MNQIVRLSVIFLLGLLVAPELLAQRECGFRPYRCRFFPSKDIQRSISFYENWEQTRRPYMERWGLHQEKVVDGIEEECASAVETFGEGSVQSCFKYKESQMVCKKRLRGFCEW